MGRAAQKVALLTSREARMKLQYLGDTIAGVVAGATLLGWLPPLAAIFTIAWTSIQIIESKTFQNIVSRFKRKEGPGA